MKAKDVVVGNLYMTRIGPKRAVVRILGKAALWQPSRGSQTVVYDVKVLYSLRTIQRKPRQLSEIQIDVGPNSRTVWVQAVKDLIASCNGKVQAPLREDSQDRLDDPQDERLLPESVKHFTIQVSPGRYKRVGFYRKKPEGYLCSLKGGKSLDLASVKEVKSIELEKSKVSVIEHAPTGLWFLAIESKHGVNDETDHG